MTEKSCIAEALACTDGVKTISIWDKARDTFYHELGHVFDAFYLKNHPERQTHLLGLMERSRLPWGWEIDSGWTGAEFFADAYSLCARLLRIDPNWEYSAGSGVLDGWRLRQVCGYLRQFPT